MKYCKKYIDENILILNILCIVNLINTIRGLYAMSKDFFLHPDDHMQKRYEALRASFVNVIFGKKAFNPLIMDRISSLPELKVL
jgi:hypothetical protein